jgi:MFS family permease
MTDWLQRGLAFAAAMVVLRVIQGVLINTWESQSALISVVLLTLFVIGVTVWGVLDGRDDAAANPDPDRRRDLAMRWLVAGLVAGAIGGAVAWLISLIDRALYAAGLVSELTVFAAFTALLVFVPAMAGVVLGRWLIDRGYAKAPQHHHGIAAHAEDRADTDVFAAVGAGATAAAGTTGTVAVTDWPTEELPADTGQTGAATEEITATIPVEGEPAGENG